MNLLEPGGLGVVVESCWDLRDRASCRRERRIIVIETSWVCRSVRRLASFLLALLDYSWSVPHLPCSSVAAAEG